MRTRLPHRCPDPAIDLVVQILATTIFCLLAMTEGDAVRGMFVALVIFGFIAVLVSGVGLGLGPQSTGRAYQALTRRFGGTYQRRTRLSSPHRSVPLRPHLGHDLARPETRTNAHHAGPAAMARWHGPMCDVETD